MNAAMEKTSREKIALIVFLILAIGMGCILFGYVFAGHSWNVTASNIDDAFGNMEGYTAIVYEGTFEEEESAAQSMASATSAANGSANSKNAGDAESLPGDSKAGDGQAPVSSSSSSDGNQAAVSSSSSSDGNQAAASSSENSQASSAASSSDKQVASSQGGSSANSASPTSASAQGTGSVDQGVSTASEPAAAEGSASEGVVGGNTAGEGVSATVSPGGTLDSQASSAAPLAGHKKEKEPVALSDVDALYQDKGANVISLHTANPSAYEEGTILKRGGKRYGIFSVTREYSRILIDEKVKYFTDQKVDYVIALCPEESYLKNAENIDIVITTADSTISSMGESRNGAFYVSTPKIGSVGAILISPSNVVSAKTISEL